MPYKRYELPEYPLCRDMWDMISEERRHIAVYGMGNGADKLFARLMRYGVSVSEVFASDGFVRGHSFRGYTVRSLSEVKAKYGDDFVILLSFASNRSEVIEMIGKINSECEMYIPDMPVAGEEYFDKDFYNAHYSEILSAYSALSDEDSKNAFAAIINYKLFGKAEYLWGCFSDTDDIYSLLPKDLKRAVDAGAYNGDTVRQLRSYRDTDVIYAAEPDKRNFKKLQKYVDENALSKNVLPLNVALWSCDGRGSFFGSGNRNSSVSSTVSYESRKEEAPLMKLDSFAEGKIDYIKYDVEGAEREALLGSEQVIKASHPALLVSAYHRSEDIFSIVNYLSEKYPFYKLYIRRTMCFPAWEIAVIAIEK